MMDDPFLIILKHDDKIYALKLKNKAKNKVIVWNKEDRFSIMPTYVLEGKEEHKEFFADKILSTDLNVQIKTDSAEIDFEVDLEKWYAIKKIPKVDASFNRDIFVEKDIFNTIISRYVSFNPSGLLADIYNLENWEAGK